MHRFISKCFLVYLLFSLENCFCFSLKPEEPILLADLLAVGNKFKSHLDSRFNQPADQNQVKSNVNVLDATKNQVSHQQIGHMGTRMAESNSLPVVSPSNINLQHQQPQQQTHPNFMPQMQHMMSPLMEQFLRMQSLHMEHQRQQAEAQQMAQSNAMAMMIPMMHNQQVSQNVRTPYMSQPSVQSPSFFYPSMMHSSNQLDHHHHQHQQMAALTNNFMFTPFSGDKALASSSLPIFVPL